MSERYSTGIAGLDKHLGGGLLPGTMTVVVGATGAGKTQFGLQFLHAGAAQEGRAGVVFDLSCRGDSQSHADYARRMFDWQLQVDPAHAWDPPRFFAADRAPGQYLHVFEYQGRRIRQRDLEFDAWQAWQAELVRKLQTAIAFLYGNFVRGVRRVVLDGIDPADDPSDSIQFELLEYVTEQIFLKDSQWVARDLFREHFLREQPKIEAHAYPREQLAQLVSVTTHESLLDQLIERRLIEGDWLANANTVIYLGRTREAGKMGRGLYIAKHRGSYASDEIVPYTIDQGGLRVA